ncbi:peroxide stress protein YaaA [Roseobacter sp. HKCCD9010]|uniref:peroxide stress protein YaaA n=1 Tax=unclassified Roseobacter TaxID=196798 RepID=UPI001491FDF2|nr:MULTISPECIES: peroxide stress protein YaaA [unclassified Roseobacter]MBF9051067.1 peroxide stress protein YaaA [Rhodobacterales bacterium HKCCD4356]NNV12836.1 peroxide stress protein YaaA [Roseobacter sp. HKCCD7357]NNV16781.1 peroxide stress protein YaaA [Roseobacter sp. HKCCD8768]NNV26587.1 peroxide stress protein YaaA [Roseobacter sp. HKCCD8192]NNV30501.1 peroxide stress protein YaaA [Roseobacter sp. HKCCD9061]
MLTVISPAKRLDWNARDVEVTTPVFQSDADHLASVARELSVPDLRKLMAISEDLGRLNHERFQRFAEEKDDTRPAALAFAGDTYAGLEAGSLDAEDLRFAQDRLRILSGLYGLLRPLDAIQAYRLEMGSRLKTEKGPSLYAYWGDRLAQALNDEAEMLGADTLINCASVEYFSAVDPKALKLPVITPNFLEDRPGGPKIVSFFAKKARGAMARFIIENRLTTPNHLSDFSLGGYRYAADLSTPEKPAFLRAEAVAA